MNIGILGYGWLGSAVGAHFLAKSEHIFATLRQEKQMHEIDSNVVCSLLDLDEPHSDFPHFFETLDVLLIAIPFSKSRNIDHVQENLRQVIKLLPVACSIILCSTIGVYKKQHEAIITEDSPLNSDKPDLVIEDLIKSLRPDSVILRLAGLIGKNRNPVVQLSQKSINDGGKSKVNLVHQNDIVKIIDRIVEQKISGHTFNVCSPEHPNRSDYYSKMALEFQVATPHFTEENSQNSIVDSSRLAQLLNFSFENSIFNR